MSIDWITVVAQLLNFLILIGLLKHFLYRPILNGIDAREQEIATRMNEAKSIKAEAQAAHREYEKQISQLEKEHSDSLVSARAETKRERDALLRETRLRIEEEFKAAQHQRQRQAKQYINQLNYQAGKIILAVTQKALNDLSDENLEERLVMHALKTLEEHLINPGVLNKTHSDSMTAQICTRNELSTTRQKRLQNSVETQWPALTLLFTNNPEQSPGALVQLESMQVDWTIDDYINDLAAALDQKLVPAIESNI